MTTEDTEDTEEEDDEVASDSIVVYPLCVLCVLCGSILRMATFFRDALLVQLDPPRVEAGNLRVADGKIVGVGADVAAAAGR